MTFYSVRHHRAVYDPEYLSAWPMLPFAVAGGWLLGWGLSSLGASRSWIVSVSVIPLALVVLAGVTSFARKIREHRLLRRDRPWLPACFDVGERIVCDGDPVELAGMVRGVRAGVPVVWFSRYCVPLVIYLGAMFVLCLVCIRLQDAFHAAVSDGLLTIVIAGILVVAVGWPLVYSVSYSMQPGILMVRRRLRGFGRETVEEIPLNDATIECSFSRGELRVTTRTDRLLSIRLGGLVRPHAFVIGVIRAALPQTQASDGE